MDTNRSHDLADYHMTEQCCLPVRLPDPFSARRAKCAVCPVGTGVWLLWRGQEEFLLLPRQRQPETRPTNGRDSPLSVVDRLDGGEM